MKLEGPSLVQSFLATDSGGSIYPFGIEWHPGFRRDLGSGPVVAHIPGQEIVWELDDDMVSTGRQLAPEGPTDLRLPMTPEIGSLDHCFRVSVGSTSFLGWPDGPTMATRRQTTCRIYRSTRRKTPSAWSRKPAPWTRFA